MIECPICGLSERCRNHWVATQEPNGEVEFQIGAMTASEDNLILLRNKLKNPPLRTLFEKISLTPEWVEQQGRTLAYLAWPLELRGAVHRTLFPMGTGNDAPLPPTIFHTHRLEELHLEGVEIDAVNCLPDELLYKARFQVTLSGVGIVPFDYMQLVFAPGVGWGPKLAPTAGRQAAESVVRLLLGGLVDPLRAIFAGHEVQVLSEEQTDKLMVGKPIDELSLPGEQERHLGEEVEKLINERRLQPMLRDQLLGLLAAPPAYLT